MGGKSGKSRRYVVDSEESLPALPAPQTAQDVRKALGQVMADLTARRMDARVATALAYVGNVMLRAIEVADLEERMSKLESTLGAFKVQVGFRRCAALGCLCLCCRDSLLFGKGQQQTGGKVHTGGPTGRIVGLVRVT